MCAYNNRTSNLCVYTMPLTGLQTLSETTAEGTFCHARNVCAYHITSLPLLVRSNTLDKFIDKYRTNEASSYTSFPVARFTWWNESDRQTIAFSWNELFCRAELWVRRRKYLARTHRNVRVRLCENVCACVCCRTTMCALLCCRRRKLSYNINTITVKFNVLDNVEILAGGRPWYVLKSTFSFSFSLSLACSCLHKNARVHD